MTTHSLTADYESVRSQAGTANFKVRKPKEKSGYSSEAREPPRGNFASPEQACSQGPQSLSDAEPGPGLAYSIALVCGTIRCPTTWSSRALARGIADQMVDHQCPKLVVLIVEDECLIRMDAIDGLMAAGFEILEAQGADEAIKILRSRSDISVVFTDIQMPGSMDGLRLAAVVRDRWPPIKIIATSGRAKIAKDQLPAEARFVAKPYDARQVAAVIVLPLPGETILVAAALLAAATGQIDIVVLAAAAGAIVGDGVGYIVGRRFGLPFLRRHGRHIGFDEDRLLIGRYLFLRYGNAVVFFWTVHCSAEDVCGFACVACTRFG